MITILLKYLYIAIFSLLLGVGSVKVIYEIAYVIMDENPGSEDIWGILVFGGILAILISIPLMLKFRRK